jgi:hypothetical protein
VQIRRKSQHRRHPNTSKARQLGGLHLVATAG